ncbi:MULTISPECIES: DUF397 domain-containing protein [Streptomyces]|uniref:DUF397 domain-containing protein n=1 Tax=Streptomyces TaxID=1883 RepID=UPI00167B9CA4|nr:MULTISPECIES: DUF397 domain-containing protein [Streptomyces]MBD3577898.1 DUF397 domain-containing protein [Streptomyces sp. KD18]GGS99531.1 hypothetical protein GCM10010286_25540 [Streptomyces toxytricini]
MNTEKRPGAANESTWFKSSYSTGSGGECVEVAASPDSVHVRDSKDTSRPGLVVGGLAWTTFVDFAGR